jgi:transcriptional regulator with XRE-family HTH domain
MAQANMSAGQVTVENEESRSLQQILQLLGRRIRGERQRKGLSQEGFAGACGLHRTEMGLLERGKTIPRLDTLLIVSEHLGLTVSKWLRGLKH